ncbi:MAG: hydantoinase/oxoprolinase family protein [Geminicoccaceae bacterium]
MPREVSLAVDIGGTFTDVVLRDGPSFFVEKTLTTADDLLRGFLTGVRAVLHKAGAAPGEVNGTIVHATTVVTNALIERTGARTAMVFTRGFADILRIRDERRYDMYDPQIEFPEPLVAPEDVFTLDERVLADGSVEKELDAEEVEALCRALRERGIATVGVCFLHSYKNARHEQRLAAELRRRLPGVHVSLSSEIAPQIREYPRASTTAANAYTVPITHPYLNRLERSLAGEGFPTHPLIMLSSGGLVGPGTAARMPVRMIESGPAAGALGAAFAARALGLRDLLAFDMGGTTAKVCLIQDSRPLVTGLFEINRVCRFKEGSGLPVTVPSVDLIEIGAGGGSIAQVSELGLLNVGPRSAGSRPGPACYGLGGTEATVTDADVVLGVIDPDKFLGGTMPLDADAAARAVARIADRLGTTTLTAARGIHRLVCEAMASAVKAHASDRGVDYRGIPLLAFGGAGPVHACEVAELLSSRTVIFPPLASVYSAFGALVTPPRLDLVRSGLTRLDQMDWTQVAERFDAMEREGRQALVEAGCAAAAITFRYAADLRYVGQHYDLMVDLDDRPSAAGGAAMLRRRFEAEYLKRYTITQDGVEVEVVNWRVVASGPPCAAPELVQSEAQRPERPAWRHLHLWQDEQDVLVMRRSALRARGRIEGPVILEEPVTTLVVPPGWIATVGELDCIIARKG